MLIQALWDNYANFPIRKWAKSAFLKLQLNCFFKIENPFQADRHFNKLLTQWFDLKIQTQTVDKHVVCQTDCHLISTNYCTDSGSDRTYVYYSQMVSNPFTPAFVSYLHLPNSQKSLISCNVLFIFFFRITKAI